MGQLYYPKTRKAQSRTNLSAFCVNRNLFKACIFLAGFLLFSANVAFAQDDLLNKLITIPKQHTTLYNALNLISDKADCLFIYDSQVVESDKKVKLVADNQPLKQVLDRILENPKLAYKVIGKHILIYQVKSENQAANLPQTVVPAQDSIKNILIRGHIFDNENKSSVPYASVGITEENIGTITNTDGYFELKVPASFSGSFLLVSHLGFMSQRIPIQLLKEQQVDIYLERRIQHGNYRVERTYRTRFIKHPRQALLRGA